MNALSEEPSWSGGWRGNHLEFRSDLVNCFTEYCVDGLTGKHELFRGRSAQTISGKYMTRSLQESNFVAGNNTLCQAHTRILEDVVSTANELKDFSVSTAFPDEVGGDAGERFVGAV